MKYTRIFADDKGESHFEDAEMEMKAAPYNTGAISQMFAAKGVMFRVSPSYFVNWHNAPRRQFVVNITGSAENQRKSLTKGRIASEQSPAVEGILPRWAAGGGTKGVELYGLAPDPVNDYEYLMQSREATFDQRIGGARH